MIGQRITGRPGSLGFVLLLALPSVGLLVWSHVARLPGLTIILALPFAVATALWLTRRPEFAADVTPTALEVTVPLLTLPYQEIECVHRAGRLSAKHFAINVQHPNGSLRIPAQLNVPSRELYDFLTSQLLAPLDQPMPAALEGYRRRQESDFGPERVFCFRARRPPTHEPRPRRLVAGFLACIPAGMFWIGAAALMDVQYILLLPFGFLLIFAGLIFALAFHYGRKSPRLKSWQESGLVISPIGLALVQGTLRGELRWDEIKKIRQPNKAAFLSNGSLPVQTIWLVVEGADILIKDAYQQPLEMIYSQLLAYWEHEPE